MTRHLRVLTISTLLLVPALAQAQDFGVTESAETIDRGNFKLKANPVFILGDGDSETGIAVGGGYGFTARFDAEAKLAFYSGVTVIGGDAEYWLIKGRHPVDVSVVGGFHFTNSDFSNSTGLDLTVIASHAATRKLDIYAALDMAFNRYTAALPDRNFTLAHVVPGIEYKIHRNLDLLAEVGIAITNNGNSYVSGGVAYYLR